MELSIEESTILAVLSIATAVRCGDCHHKADMCRFKNEFCRCCAGNSFKIKTVILYNNFAQKSNMLEVYDDGECLIRIGVRTTIT
ncbi:hypothetical protein M8J77_004189 [Diaphorina citri]|nr:hypothetical protein M8J77_004189 [Diaphorina citri]